ncbi:MAG: hypothetical protein FJW31_16400 [Acidobacteria bacterium]|nr:hypothetical protein [Acidobacteriota bacterium]
MSSNHYIPDLSSFRNKAFFVGLAGVLVAVYGMTSNSEQFMRSYLLAFLFSLLIPVTCNGLLCLHHLVGGQWGILMRPLLEAGSRTLWINLLFSIPILLNVPALYEWARPEVVANDHILQNKAAWLNVHFWSWRIIFYFLVWILLGYYLNLYSNEQAAGRNEEETEAAKEKLRNLSGPGLVLHILTLTFAAFDLGMSLEPHWPSTMYGVLYLIGGALVTMAFMILVMRRLTVEAPMSHLVKVNHFRDWGTLLFAFVCLWAYVNFSQFLIIWSANLPEETPWYVKRTQGPWSTLAGCLMLFHFALPFLLLLIRFNKKKSAILGFIAAFMIVMKFLDLAWLIAPAFHEVEEAGHQFLHWLDVVTPVGLFGLWAGFFAYQLGRKSLMPVEAAKLPTGGHH